MAYAEELLNLNLECYTSYLHLLKASKDGVEGSGRDSDSGGHLGLEGLGAWGERSGLAAVLLDSDGLRASIFYDSYKVY